MECSAVPNVGNQDWFHVVMALQSPAAYFAETPGPTDILLGRGRKNQQHPGNISFISKIEECLPLYHGHRRGKKQEIVSLIMAWLAARNGHFVKRGAQGYWVEVSEAVAKEKVAQAFRHRKLVHRTIPPGSWKLQPQLIQNVHSCQLNQLCSSAKKSRRINISNNGSPCPAAAGVTDEDDESLPSPEATTDSDSSPPSSSGELSDQELVSEQEVDEIFYDNGQPLVLPNQVEAFEFLEVEAKDFPSSAADCERQLPLEMWETGANPTDGEDDDASDRS